eukprot:gene2966-2169_t
MKGKDEMIVMSVPGDVLHSVELLWFRPANCSGSAPF